MNTGAEVTMIQIRKDGISARDVLALMPDAIALIYSPTECFFALTRKGELTKENDQKVDPDLAYEIRLFTNDAELRWRRDGKTGNTVICSEEDQSNLPAGFTEIQKITAHPHESKYLLWGEYESGSGTEPDSGWSVFSDTRIGKLPVPNDAEKKDRAKIRVREYFTRSDDGNMVFAGERLMAVECDMEDAGDEQ